MTFELRGVPYDTAELLRIYDTSGFQAAGGVTTELLRLEVQHAAAFLVPFIKWVRLLGVKPDSSRVAEFLDFYDPHEPLHDYFQRLEALRF